jgi:hypothetical protein
MSHNFSNVMINSTSLNEAHYEPGHVLFLAILLPHLVLLYTLHVRVLNLLLVQIRFHLHLFLVLIVHLQLCYSFLQYGHMLVHILPGVVTIL